jgi:hypothetical protein
VISLTARLTRQESNVEEDPKVAWGETFCPLIINSANLVRFATAQAWLLDAGALPR